MSDWLDFSILKIILICASIGDRDETYRNLGFLLPTGLQDSSALPNISEQIPTDYQDSTYPPFDWA